MPHARAHTRARPHPPPHSGRRRGRKFKCPLNFKFKRHAIGSVTGATGRPRVASGVRRWLAADTSAAESTFAGTTLARSPRRHRDARGPSPSRHRAALRQRRPAMGDKCGSCGAGEYGEWGGGGGKRQEKKTKGVGDVDWLSQVHALLLFSPQPHLLFPPPTSGAASSLSFEPANSYSILACAMAATGPAATSGAGACAAAGAAPPEVAAT